MVSQSQPVTAQTATIATAKSFYRPELDALRFAAFVMMFVFHAPRPYLPVHSALWYSAVVNAWTLFVRAGAYSLSIFFLLSAYLITELLLREQERTGTLHLKAFYVRRILRIWPLYFLGVALGIAFGLATGKPLRSSEIVLLVFFVAWAGGSFGGNPVGPLWSISVEELFYLIWPAVAKYQRGRALLAFSIATVPLSLLAVYWNDYWYNPLNHFLFFGTGTLLAIRLHGKRLLLPAAVRVALIVVGYLLFLSIPGNMLPFSGRLLPVVQFAATGLGSAAIFVAFLNMPCSWVPQPFLYLGQISYGLYAFHLFAMDSVRMLIAGIGANPDRTRMIPVSATLSLAVTIVVAALSYRYFETPFLQLKRRFTFVKSAH